MKGLKRKLRAYFGNYRHVLCLLLTLAFLSVAVCCFITTHLRMGEAFVDVWTSFCELFEIGGTAPTVTEISAVDLIDLGILPYDLELFKVKLQLFGESLINRYSLELFGYGLAEFLSVFIKAALFVIPFLILFLVFVYLDSKTVNAALDDTKAVKKLRRAYHAIKRPVSSWLGQMSDFIKGHKAYYIIWAIIWAYSFNGFTIALEFIAYYFHFACSFDFANLYIQAYKLLLDLSVVLTFFPGWLWCVFGVVLYNVLRHHIAFKKIKKNEEKCEDAIKKFPVASLITGPMGTKKTTFSTEIAITANKIFRQKAYDIIFNNDFKLPDFPWARLEHCILKGIETHRLYNLESCRRFVRQLRKLEELRRSGIRRTVYDNALHSGFDYDFGNYLFDYPEEYPREYVSELGVESIWKVLENYVCAFFIYCISTTLLVANYSIRVDDYIESEGHFPKWNQNFFRKDKQKVAREHTRYAHVLDFDALRLGKIMLANNKMKDALDFGIIVITEVGKERGNQLTVKARNITLDVANQNNDFFNIDVKLCRHRATVDNYPFILYLTDENRAGSVNADLKELMDLLYISKSSDWNIITTLFAVDELLYDWLTDCMKKYQMNFKYSKGGLNIFAYALRGLYVLMWRHYQKIYCRYSVSSLELSVCDGKEEGEKTKSVYKLSKWKIHNARFTTDALSAYYRYKTGRSRYGIVDIPDYKDICASMDELNSSHSYLVEDLSYAFISDESDKKSA